MIDRIEELLALAEPLRALDDSDPAKEALGAIVDEINKLRNAPPPPEPAPDIDPERDAVVASLAAKRPVGRPRKVA